MELRDYFLRSGMTLSNDLVLPRLLDFFLAAMCFLLGESYWERCCCAYMQIGRRCPYKNARAAAESLAWSVSPLGLPGIVLACRLAFRRSKPGARFVRT
jgi:hypothetical protein